MKTAGHFCLVKSQNAIIPKATTDNAKLKEERKSGAEKKLKLHGKEVRESATENTDGLSKQKTLTALFTFC